MFTTFHHSKDHCTSFPFQKAEKKPPHMIYDQTHKFSVITDCEHNSIFLAEHMNQPEVKNVSQSQKSKFLSQLHNSCDFHNYDY